VGDESTALNEELYLVNTELCRRFDDLLRENDETGESRDRYAELYHRAPVGYVTIGAGGGLRQGNRAAAELLGTTCDDLVETYFDRFVHSRDKGIWERFFRSLAEPGEHHCELRLRGAEGNAHVQLSSQGSNREGALVALSDVSELKRVEAVLRARDEEMRALVAGLHRVREEERAAAAREIHDALGQILTALVMDLAGLQKDSRVRSPVVRRRLAQMRDLVAESIQTVRRICASLRPAILDDLGLDAAVEWAVDETVRRAGLVCSLDIGPVPAMTEDGKTTVFRVLQEALTNVSRHAGATRLAVSLRERGGACELRVEDDGVGMAETALGSTSSIGLIGMRERAAHLGGKLHIAPRPGGGTVIELRIPLRR
jgi:PAS domain S-box-containing protein